MRVGLDMHSHDQTKSFTMRRCCSIAKVAKETSKRQLLSREATRTKKPAKQREDPVALLGHPKASLASQPTSLIPNPHDPQTSPSLSNFAAPSYNPPSPPDVQSSYPQAPSGMPFHPQPPLPQGTAS
ncbi:hypothetical protein QTJ16_006777 [Diplocarpon rosae]|uniref:Uncharacterized protein n=1 Tax=Diplocarpon rosae TaxID=946125 RepID=A0AAD9ST26_9HELO|nr:hypothetical protein QTJ16_006777 [Diplocarpon rosae]